MWVGYQAEPYRANTVYYLGAGLAVLSVFQLAPAAGHLDVASAPDWARVLIVLAMVQLAYCAWMVLVPDWSTVWIAMLVFAVVTALYGAALGAVMFTPTGEPVLLGMDEVRQPARLWCGAILLLSGLMTYVCGRISFWWRRAYLTT